MNTINIVRYRLEAWMPSYQIGVIAFKHPDAYLGVGMNYFGSDPTTSHLLEHDLADRANTLSVLYTGVTDALEERLYTAVQSPDRARVRRFMAYATKRFGTHGLRPLDLTSSIDDLTIDGLLTTARHLNDE